MKSTVLEESDPFAIFTPPPGDSLLLHSVIKSSNYAKVYYIVYHMLAVNKKEKLTLKKILSKSQGNLRKQIIYDILESFVHMGYFSKARDGSDSRQRFYVLTNPTFMREDILATSKQSFFGKMVISKNNDEQE